MIRGGIVVAFITGAILVGSVAFAGAAKRKHVDSRASKNHGDSSHMTTPTDPTAMPAYRYSHMSRDECESELTARKISFTRETAPGVFAPVRLGGPIRGVTFRTGQPAKARESSKWELADCRLVLALDDFAEILKGYGIVEVRHYSMYRPPGKSWPEGKVAKQHNGGVAIDAGRFIDGDGKVLDVDKDFHGAIDAKTCGDGAGPVPATPEANKLRSILCDAVEHHLFNVVLTPNYNKAHHNHFHLEVNGAKWQLVH
jgi:hypothetical protein